MEFRQLILTSSRKKLDYDNIPTCQAWAMGMELLIIISFIGKPYQIEIIQSDRTIRFNDVTTLHFRANPTNFLCIDYKVEGSGLFICTQKQLSEEENMGCI